MRIVLPVMLAVMLLLGSVTPVGSQAQHTVTVLVPSRTPTPGSPIAQAQGYFQEEGLNVTIVYACSVDVFNFLGLGRGDFVTGASPVLIRSVRNGDPVKSFCTSRYRYSWARKSSTG